MNPFRTPLDPPPKARPLPFRPQRRPDLTIEQILEWCDAFHKRFGRWPTDKDGPRGLPDTTWRAIDKCLRHGYRGLRSGSSLAKLLLAHRERRHLRILPRFTVARILKWADDHHARTGGWPNADMGPIVDAPGETWKGVDSALRSRRRGLPGHSSLAQLLAAKRGVRNPRGLRALTAKQILAWADKHYAQTGDWPTADSGAVQAAPGETWIALDSALRGGKRGLPGGSSLAKLLFQCRGRRHRRFPPNLTIDQILGWANAQHQRTGKWPNGDLDSVIPETPEETWTAVESALRNGRRGLPGGDSLARLLARACGVRNSKGLPRLSVKQIQCWVQAHYRRTGNWPNYKDGPIPDTRGETWSAVAAALCNGRRGLPGGSSLAQVVAALKGKSPAK